MVERGGGFVLAAMLALGGCAAKAPVTLVTTAATNGGRPVAIDVLCVGDEPARALLGTLTSRDYFAQRMELQRGFGRQVSWRAFELPPGGSAKAAPCRRGTTIVFADYHGGSARLTIPSNAAGDILLGDTSMAWVGAR